MGCKRTTRNVITSGIDPIPPPLPPPPSGVFRSVKGCGNGQGGYHLCSRSCPFSLGSCVPYIADNPNQVVLFTRYVSYGIVVCISVQRVPYLLPFHSMQCRSLLSNYTFLPYCNITFIYATNVCRLKYLIGSDVDVNNKQILHKRFKWGLRSDKLMGFAGEILFFQKNSATTSSK